MTAASPQQAPQKELAPECIALPLDEVWGGDRRLDAEVYLSEGFLKRRGIEQSSLTAVPLGELANIWQPSRLKGIQVSREHGVPFLAATQVFDIWPTPRKWLAPSRTPNVSERYVDAGWILVTCSGSVGDAIITYTPHEGIVISHDILRIQPVDGRQRGYIYTFLRTRHGRAMMRSSHYGNIIKHLEVDHLVRLSVPLIDRLIEELDNQITSVFAMRDEAYRLDLRARQRFSNEIGETPEPAGEEGFTVETNELFGKRRRFDAYAHNPDALAVLDLLDRKGRSIAPLIDVATPVMPPRFKRIYGDVGVPYWSSEDIFRINPEISKFLTPATPADLSEYRVEPGWLLMVRSGQIYGINGSVLLASQLHEGKIITEDIIRIIPIPRAIRPGYLQAVLSHPKLGQPLVLRTAFGTSIPHIAPEDVATIQVVRLSEDAEDEIADAVEKASELRVKADEKENGAVARLEEELEAELEKSGGKKKHGPLRIPLDFDEAMKRAVQVPPPDEDAVEEA